MGAVIGPQAGAEQCRGAANNVTMQVARQSPTRLVGDGQYSRRLAAARRYDRRTRGDPAVPQIAGGGGMSDGLIGLLLSDRLNAGNPLLPSGSPAPGGERR